MFIPGGGACGENLSRTEIGFVLDSGEITGFSCASGVYGCSDGCFIDFSVGGPSLFLARDGNGGNIIGTYSIHRIPEPPPLTLISLVLAGLGLRRRKPN